MSATLVIEFERLVPLKMYSSDYKNGFVGKFQNKSDCLYLS